MATSLTDSAAALQLAGNSLEQSTAILTAGNTILQDPQQVSTAMKVVSLRIRGVTSDLQEMGETTDDVLNKSKLQSKIKALTGVDIVDANGAFRSTYDILVDIGEAYQDLDSMSQASVLELLAGKTRANALAAVIQNVDILKEAYQSALESEGSAMNELDVYMNSIQGKLDQFTNAIQTLWNNTIDSDIIKFFVNLGTSAIQFLDTVYGKATATILAIDAFTFKTVKNLLIQLKSLLKFDDLKYQLQTAFASVTRVVTQSLTSFDSTKLIPFLNGKIEVDSINKITHALGAELTANQQLSREVAKQILLKNGVQQADIDGALAAIGFAAANDTLTFSFKRLGAAIWTSLKAFFASPIGAIAVIITAIVGIIHVTDKLTTTMEEADDAFDGAKSSLDAAESDLKGLEQQLDDVNDKIKEINENEALSFTDQEELERLKAESVELQRQIHLTKQLKDQQQRELNNQAKETAKMYKDKGVKSGKTTAERTANGAKWGAGIGAFAGALLGTIFLGPFGLLLGGALGLAAGAAVGSTAGKLLGKNESKVGDSIDNMREEYAKQEEAYEKAKADYYSDSTNKKKKEAYEAAKESYETYTATMAEDLQALDEYYRSIDLSVYTDSKERQAMQKEIQDFYDAEDKWAIQTGGANAKENAFARIFGENATDEIKAAKQKYIDALNDGEAITLEEAFGDTEAGKAAFEDLKQRFYDLGTYVAEAETYLVDFKNALEEIAETNLYDIVPSVATAEDAISSLKSAFEEANEAGQITAKTLQELNNTFGSMEGISDEWENYVNVMMSGVASTQEMTEATRQLAEAWIDEKLTSEPLDLAERIALISQLTSWGFTNAYDYVNDAQKEAGYEKIADAIKTKTTRKNEIETRANELKQNSDNLTAAELEEWNQLSKEFNTLIGELNFSNPQDLEYLTEIANEYGIATVELDKYIDKLQEYAQAKTNLEEAETKYENYKGWKQNYKNAEEELKKYQELVDAKKQLEQYQDVIDAKEAANGWAYAGVNQYGEVQYRKGEDVLSGSGVQALTNRYKQLAQQNPGFNDAWQQYEQLLKKYPEYETALQKLKDLEEEGRTNGYIDKDGNITNLDYAEFVEEAKTAFEKIKTEIEDELTLDIQLQLDLQNKNQLVDDIQSIFDTLASAQEEFLDNNSEYLTVDTVQSLLELEPKYLTLLYDENNQLNLNKDTLYKVAEARLTDLGIQAQKNILEEATKVATEGSIESMKELIEITEQATATNEAFIATQLGIIQTTLEKRVTDEDDELFGNTTFVDEYISGVQKQLDAVTNSINLAKKDLSNSLSSSGNTAKAATESALERLQKKYERKISALSNQQQYIENEISQLEAKDETVGKAVYEEQKRLENLKIKENTARLGELKALLAKTPKNSDEWLKYLARCNRNITMYPFELLGNP